MNGWASLGARPRLPQNFVRELILETKRPLRPSYAWLLFSLLGRLVGYAPGFKIAKAIIGHQDAAQQHAGYASQ